MSLQVAISPGGALAAMAQRVQFILWTIRDGRKLPINPHTSRVCNAHDPSAWVTADEALSISELYGPAYGVGFVFTATDDFFFLDIDKCAQDGLTWSPLACELVAQFPGAAVEVSQSGKGLHIFGRAAQMPHSNKDIQRGIELYTDGRFVALTGTGITGDSGTDHTGALATLIPLHFPPKGGADSPTGWTDGPAEGWDGTTDDKKLIAAALRSRSAGSAFGDKATFADLWKNNEDALAVAFPDPGGVRAYDASSADMSLAQHLAFWTGNDCARILRLMGLSSLVREKWEREDYLYRTITGATSRQTEFYKKRAEKVPVEPSAPMDTGAPAAATATPAAATPMIRADLQYLAPAQQLEYFRGCVYVRDLNKIFTPDGALLKAEVFRPTYAGYLFALDSIGDKTTKDAWEAFTASQAWHFPKVHSTCFRPRLEPGAIIFENGQSLVNVYVPVPVRIVEGNPAPILDLLARLLPVEADRNILLAYMAACVQYQGVKFQWAPLIQGAEGNGKTALTRAVANAIGRKYVHLPSAADIDNKFTGWRFRKVFIGVEDIYTPDHKREVIEAIKPMITNEYADIQFKGADQITLEVCDNFMFNSNHKDAIRKTRTDRRFCVFYTAQQDDGDIERDGMGGTYFPRFYDWLKADGYAIMAGYLREYRIPDHLNPATTCVRAPVTSSTAEALTVSLGGVEQEILEAIDAGDIGFANGWVSSIYLDRLLDRVKAARRIPPNKRREVMKSLGYVYHPSLRGGRVNSPIDGAKPRLYIRSDHPDLTLSSPSEVVGAYTWAQQPPESVSSQGASNADVARG